VLDVALEVPLAALGFGRLLQRDHARAPRIQVLHEALDGAALARRVAALEQDHHALPGFLDPCLQLEQFHLKPVLLLLVVLRRFLRDIRLLLEHLAVYGILRIAAHRRARRQSRAVPSAMMSPLPFFDRMSRTAVSLAVSAVVVPVAVLVLVVLVMAAPAVM
jgi:hypothetical protein